MIERPILFSGPMMRAILDGRKTQTRRVVKVRGEQPPAWATFAPEGHSPTYTGSPKPTGLFYWSEEQPNEGPLKTLRRWPILPPGHPVAGDNYWTPCPHGKPDDHLWVRETCRAHERNDGLDGVLYPADNAFAPIAGTNEAVDRWIALNSYRGARGATVPAIHMPRWASRITLEITGVRVERLQHISEADAIAEGIDKTAAGFWSAYGQREVDGTYSPRLSYQCLWDSLNAARGHGWDTNPWVWVVEFRRAP